MQDHKAEDQWGPKIVQLLGSLFSRLETKLATVLAERISKPPAMSTDNTQDPGGS